MAGTPTPSRQPLDAFLPFFVPVSSLIFELERSMQQGAAVAGSPRRGASDGGATRDGRTASEEYPVFRRHRAALDGTVPASRYAPW